MPDLEFQIFYPDWGVNLGWCLWLAGLLSAYEQIGYSRERLVDLAVRMTTRHSPLPTYRVTRPPEGWPPYIEDLLDRSALGR